MRALATSLVLASMSWSLVASPVHASEPQPVLVGPPAATRNGCPADVEWTKAVVSRATGFSLADMELGMTWRALTINDFCMLAPNRIIRAISRVNKPKPDSPGDWAKARAEDQADENGIVKPDGLMAALAQREAMVASPGLSVAGLRTDSWTNLGPGNIGGRIRAISINPANTSEILIGSVSGGFFRSTNSGASFTAVNDFLVNLAVSTIARDPNTPTRIYAGTGEGFFNSDAIRGYGVFVSTNGGTAWSQLGNTIPDMVQPPSSQTADFAYVNRVAVHPTDSNIVLVATSGYYCNWGGLYRTTNALSGTPTWTRVYSRRALDVKFDPNNPNRVVVGEGSHCDPTGGSDNGGGVGFVNDITTAVAANSGNSYIGSFTRTKLNASSTGRVELAFGPATNGLVVALQDYNGGMFYVSTNSGQTWAQNSGVSQNSNVLSTQGWYDNVVWIDPFDSTRIIIGGIDLWKGAAAANWWTTNTEVVFSRVSQWQFGGSYGNSAHADHHAIVADPGYNGTSNRRVYFGNDGGLYKAEDVSVINGDSAGTGWAKLNNGMEITQFYSGAGTIVGGVTRIQGGTQDNGQLYAPASGTNWTTWQGGDGGYAAVDPADTNIFYGAYVRGAISRTKTAGAGLSYICKGTANNVNNITEGLAGASYCGTLATSEANFITPFILDPNNSDRMLVGAKSLWISNDAKTAATPSWAIRKAAAGGTSSFYINAIAVAPGNSDIIWVGHNNGQVYCTTNGTNASPTWSMVASTPARKVLRIMVDQSNNNRVFVAYGGYTSPNLYETTSGCVASPVWTARHNNLPAAPVRSVVRHPSNANWIYVSTEVGVFASTDGGVNWSTTAEGPGSVSTDELFWLDSATLVAATHGRGMFKTTIAPGSLQFDQAAMSVPEGGGSVTVFVTRSGGSAGSVSVTYNTIAEVGAGKATSGSDYAVASGNLTWADSETGTKSFVVNVTNDVLVEGAETFRVDLSAPTGGASLGGTSSVTVTINDNDTFGPNDFNADNKPDLIWSNTSSGATYIWRMNGLSLLSDSLLATIDPIWKVQGVGDFNSDGHPDVVWRHTGTGNTYVWYLVNGVFQSDAFVFSLPPEWVIQGVADFNADGKPDFLMRNTTSGNAFAWFFNNNVAIGDQFLFNIDPSWKVEGVADLNADNQPDLLFRNMTSGLAFAWNTQYAASTLSLTTSSPSIFSIDTAWEVVQVADWNADGKPDLVFRNKNSGVVFVWYLDGTTLTTSDFIIQIDPVWEIVPRR